MRKPEVQTLYVGRYNHQLIGWMVPGFKSRPKTFRQVLRPTYPRIAWIVGLFARIEAAGREVDHSNKSSAEI